MKRGPRTVLALVAAVAALLGLVTVAQAAGGKADFTLTAGPSSLAVQQGKSGRFTITSVSTNGFTGAVALTVTGLPAGSTGAPAPTSLTMSSGSTQTSALPVSVGKTTPAGSYALTVTGRSGNVTKTATAALVVQQTPGALSITSSPTTATISPGQAAVYTLSLTRTGSATGAAVALTASGFPTGATATFSPQNATGASATLTIATTSSTLTGTSTITVTGTTSTGSTASAAVTLVVAQASGKPFTIAAAVEPSLSPGVFVPLDLQLTNSNNQPLAVTNLTVTISSPTTTGCTSDNFGAVQYRGSYPFVLPAGATRASLTQLTGTSRDRLPQVGMVNLNRNQDACKGGKPVVLTFTGTAQGD